jgi:predicted peptidase
MQNWSPMIEPLNALLDQIQTRYATDPSRIYLTGLSLGGFGTWEFGLRYPQRFAALAPIAGGYYFGSRGIPPRLCDLKNVPIWAFHGALDETVEPYQSEVLVDGLRACGARIRFTLYGDADHEASWRRAYADPELYRWLLSNSLGR